MTDKGSSPDTGKGGKVGGQGPAGDKDGKSAPAPQQKPSKP